ncbi:MAG TPA: DUF4019 domain-containing protein [Bryocella sp.]|nr:DUF4019 domain-containing protein [Bryocella sp.]
MKPFSKVIGLLLVVLTFVGITAAADDNLNAATDAAQKWLALVDAGSYGESWDQASSLFKEKLTMVQWQQALTQVRTPLGKLESRQFKAAQYKTELPQAPPGKYMVLQYRTKFANGGLMIETITPMLDKDGTWRVSGYYIKPITN